MNILIINKLNQINYFILLAIAPAIVSGPFLSDLILSISGIIYLFNLLILKFDIIKFKKLFYLFISFCFYLIFTSIISDYPFHSLESSLLYFRYGFFVLSVLLVCEKKEYFLRNFFIVLIITYLFVIFDSYYQFFFLKDLLGFKADVLRISGPFGDELIMGSFLSRFFPIVIGFFLYIYQYRYKKLFLFLLILFSFVSIILSAERSAILYFCITIFFLLFIKNYRIIIIYSLSLIFFISILAMKVDFTDTKLKRLEEIKDRIVNVTYQQIFNDTDKDGVKDSISIFSNIHESHYRITLNMFKSSPIYGVGPNNFRILCNNKKFNLDKEGCSTHPHNTYIQLLGETGIIGCLFILILFLFISFKLIYYTKDVSDWSNKNTQLQYFSYIALLISFWPVVPTANFFNNWINIFYFLPIPFILFLYKK